MSKAKALLTLAAGTAVGSLAWLIYGTLVEANRLVVEKRRLKLPGWPKRLAGYRIGVLADIHVRDKYTVAHAQRAVAALLDEDPDMIVIPGDLVGYWKDKSPWLLSEVLESLVLMNGHVIAVPGNHDYWSGDAELLAPILDELNIKLLRNQMWRKDGITWVGIDSANAKMAEPIEPMTEALMHDEPIVVLWHEPDLVESLPQGAVLMISGHSHGGQWRFPGGLTPMKTRNGAKYLSGFFPDAPTPLYVSRGLATTGPPARFGADPEVTLLTLDPA